MKQVFKTRKLAVARFPIAAKIALLLVSLLFSTSQAECKIGDAVSNFILKQKKVLKLKGSSTKEGTAYYSFSLLVDDSERQAAPGFGGGCTITVKEGKIAGQSMAVCLGTDRFMGTQLAGAYGLKFACEAIGRTIPGDKDAQDRELEVFNRSASEALVGLPKEIKYKGFEPKIILSRSQDGNLLIAVVKSEPAPPLTPGTQPTGMQLQFPPGTQRSMPQQMPPYAVPQRTGIMPAQIPWNGMRPMPGNGMQPMPGNAMQQIPGNAMPQMPGNAIPQKPGIVSPKTGDVAPKKIGKAKESGAVQKP